eukprot:TRINITY_DN55141_c0_g1_i1.p1 TRINITY_DN55141_c0_g1~~TRINITY_DN55141_c0_g1_i1.p1  ORF type:complete len:591 (+),score=145.17 TRINITY_DN55141_c0_g1_i1:68-1840(+)
MKGVGALLAGLRATVANVFPFVVITLSTLALFLVPVLVVCFFTAAMVISFWPVVVVVAPIVLAGAALGLCAVAGALCGLVLLRRFRRPVYDRIVAHLRSWVLLMLPYHAVFATLLVSFFSFWWSLAMGACLLLHGEVRWEGAVQKDRRWAKVVDFFDGALRPVFDYFPMTVTLSAAEGAAGCGDAPRQLVVSPPELWPELGGIYDRQPGLVRGLPWWQKQDGPGWLANNRNEQSWMFSLTREHFDGGLGWLASEEHRGLMPHCVAAWKTASEERDATWHYDASVRVAPADAASAAEEWEVIAPAMVHTAPDQSAEVLRQLSPGQVVRALRVVEVHKRRFVELQPRGGEFVALHSGRRQLLQMRARPPVLFCYHPHGVYCFGLLTLVFAGQSGLDAVMPGRSGRGVLVAVASALLHVPLFGTLVRWFGFVPAGRCSLDAALRTEHDVALVPGGIAEMLMPGDEGHEELYLASRRGFCELAIRHGRALIPVYGFGETATFRHLRLFSRLRAAVSRRLRVGVALFHGRYGTLTPYRTPVRVVVGQAVPVAQCDDPTPEAVDELHRRYVAAVRRLFEQNQHLHPSYAHKALCIV